jgi:phospholipid/cholesterol/gamma-HCH transport system substrate-binding protein
LTFSKELKTGVFAVVSILLFILGFQYMRDSKLFQVSREFHVVYPNVVGLERSAAVTINGMKVGKVSDIKLINSQGDAVMVTFIIEDDFEFSKSSVIKIYRSGIIGGNNLAVLTNGSDPMIAQAGDTLVGALESGMIDGLIEKFTPIEKSLLSTLTKVDSVMLDLDQVLDQAAKRHLRQSMADLSSTMDQLNQTSTSLNTLVQHNEAYLNNTFADLGRTASNMAKITDSIALINSATLLNDLSESMNALKQITAAMASGEGTLGALINDPSLYQNLEQVTKEAQKLVEDIKAQPKRYVHFSLFGSKEESSKEKDQ